MQVASRVAATSQMDTFVTVLLNADAYEGRDAQVAAMQRVVLSYDAPRLIVPYLRLRCPALPLATAVRLRQLPNLAERKYGVSNIMPSHSLPTPAARRLTAANHVTAASLPPVTLCSAEQTPPRSPASSCGQAGVCGPRARERASPRRY